MYDNNALLLVRHFRSYCWIRRSGQEEEQREYVEYNSIWTGMKSKAVPAGQEEIGVSQRSFCP